MHNIIKGLAYYITLVCITLWSTGASADSANRDTGFTLDYHIGSSYVDVSGFNGSRASGYMVGWQGKYVGLLLGSEDLGGYSPTTNPNFGINIKATELLLSVRFPINDFTTAYLYAGQAAWDLSSYTYLTTAHATGTSPAAGIALRFGGTIGFKLSAMYYRDVSDANILATSIGVAF